jgi:hypothetical protein
MVRKPFSIFFSEERPFKPLVRKHRQKIKKDTLAVDLQKTGTTGIPSSNTTRLCENKNKKCLGFLLKEMNNKFMIYQ